MSEAVRAVLFDLGEVLMAYDVRRITDGIAGLLPGVSGEEILGPPGTWELIAGAERGEFGPGRFRDILNERFGLSLSESEWAGIWNLGILGPMDGMESLVRRLKGTCTLGVLSNTVAWHWEEALRRLPVLSLFEYYFLSYELSCRKPEPEIYETALEVLQVDPGEVVFIDDRTDNVEGAERVGLRALLFEGPENLAEDLRRMEIRAPGL